MTEVKRLKMKLKAMRLMLMLAPKRSVTRTAIRVKRYSLVCELEKCFV